MRKVTGIAWSEVGAVKVQLGRWAVADKNLSDRRAPGGFPQFGTWADQHSTEMSLVEGSG